MVSGGWSEIMTTIVESALTCLFILLITAVTDHYHQPSLMTVIMRLLFLLRQILCLRLRRQQHCLQLLQRKVVVAWSTVSSHQRKMASLQVQVLSISFETLRRRRNWSRTVMMIDDSNDVVKEVDISNTIGLLTAACMTTCSTSSASAMGMYVDVIVTPLEKYILFFDI